MTEHPMAPNGSSADDSVIEQAATGAVMANDSDWVADVRRWYFSSQQPTQIAAAPGETPDDIGYEAAQPVLQARHWPDAPVRAVIEPS